MKNLISKIQTKKNLFSKFSLVILLITINYSFSQCVSVNAGVDQTNCEGVTNLSMTYTPVKATTSYSVAPITYNPASFTAGSLALATNIDDTYSGSIPIGFCFKFYGNTYTQCVVGSNGLITFDPADANQYCDWVITNSLPSNGLPMNSIMAPYHDIYPSVDPATGTSEIRYNTYGTAPCRTFVVSWSNVPMFDCTEMINNQQIILYETTNVIEVYIKDKPLCTTWNDGLAILGIQNAAGTIFTAAPGKNSTQWAATNEGYRFSPAGAEISTVQWFQSGISIASTVATTVSPSVTTTYTAQITIPTCTAPGSLVLTDDMVVTISASVTPIFSPVSGICQSDVLALLPTTSLNLITGTWSSVLGSGTSGSIPYSFTPSIGQCASSITMNVDVITPIITTFLPIANVCQNDVAPILPLNSTNIPAITGTWSSLVNTSTVGSTVYTFTPESGQCAISATMNITVTPLIIPTFSAISVLCLNSIPPVLPVNSTNSISIAGIWTPAVSTSTIGSVTYTFNPLAGQCSAPTTMDIVTMNEVTPIFSTIPPLCYGSIAPVLASSSMNSPAINGIWSSPINTSVVGVQSYTFTPFSGQCATSVLIDVIVNSLPDLVIHDPSPVCFPEVVDLTLPEVTTGSTGELSYFVTVTGSIPLSSPSLINTSGIYYIASESSFGCKVIMPVNVVVNLQPYASFNPSESKLNLFNSSSVMINSSTGAISSSWIFPDGSTSSLNSPEHIFSDTAFGNQLITLIVTSIEGCTDTTVRVVNMEEELIFYVPNTFTPDDDNFNQTFKPIFASGYDATDYTMLIYNRWGQLVFETHDVFNAWNGDSKEGTSKVSDGVYIWKMEFKINRKGKHVLYTGNVNVLR